MAKPAKRNLLIFQGGTFTDVITWRAGSPPEPVDLTGCSARMQVRADVTSDEVLLDLSTGAGITLGGATGRVTTHIHATDTAALTWAEGVYDLEIEFGDGTVRRLTEGMVRVSPEVTRA